MRFRSLYFVLLFSLVPPWMGQMLCAQESQVLSAQDAQVLDVQDNQVLDAQDNQVLSLDSCLQAARLHNATIQSSKLDVEAADYVRRAVMAKFFPQVSASGFAFHGAYPLIRINIFDAANQIATNAEAKRLIEQIKQNVSDPNAEIQLMPYAWSAGATAVQPIFAGGRIVNGYRLSKLGIEAAEKQAQITERDVLQQVEETYWMLAGLQLKRQTVAGASQLLDTAEHLVSASYDAGLVTRNDLMKVQLKRDELASQRLQLENGIRLTTNLLAVLTNLPIEVEPTLQSFPNAEEIQVPILVDTFRVNGRPEAELLAMQVLAAKYQKAITVGEVLPSIALGANAGVANLFDKSRSNVVGFLTVQIPLSAWGEQAYKIKEHNVRIRQAEMQQKEFIQKMALQNEQVYNQLTEAVQLLLQYDKSHQLAQDNYRLARLNYEAGASTITELLESQMLLFQSESAYCDALTAYFSALRKFRDFNK